MRVPVKLRMLQGLALLLAVAPVSSGLRGPQGLGKGNYIPRDFGRGLQPGSKPAWRTWGPGPNDPSGADVKLKIKPSGGVGGGRGGGGPATAAAPRGGSLAVVISGLRSRLVLNSTLERVVQPAVRSGYSVSLFLSLVGSTSTGESFSAHGLSDPNLVDKSPEDLRRWTEQAVAGVGGHLAHFVHRAEPEELGALPTDELHRSFMYDYSPGDGSVVGLNVLRRWRSSEELLNKTLGAGQPVFDFVLWEREDQYWLRPLWLFNFPSPEESASTVFAKNCLGWGGLNDKSLLLGRNAARVLLGAYASFWLQEPSLRSRNAEQYLEALARLQGLQVRRMPFQVLPSTDATFAPGAGKGKGEGDGLELAPGLCIRSFYSCKSELPAGSPPFCPDDSKAKAAGQGKI